MEGIVKGIPRGQTKPTVDGIVKGIERKEHKKVLPETKKVEASSTKFSMGVFGAGPTPEGDGDPSRKSYKGMKLAH